MIMKEYKLIKTYPGSPESGTIAKDKICYEFRTYTNGRYKGKLRQDLILNQPEFWEEIVEKNYEILSFKQNSGIKDLWLPMNTFKENWARFSNCKFTTKIYKYKDILNNNLYQINSIKRLSDGKIFTLKDRITTGVDTDHFCAIYHFELRKNNSLEINCTHSFLASEQNVDIFKTMQPIEKKQPLFTTEDGVDVFEGDTVWNVSKNNYILHKWQKMNKNLIQNSVKYFSTRLIAENYIIKNKPCLSLNDVKLYCNWINFNDLIELVKDKLNLN